MRERYTDFIHIRSCGLEWTGISQLLNLFSFCRPVVYWLITRPLVFGFALLYLSGCKQIRHRQSPVVSINLNAWEGRDSSWHNMTDITIPTSRRCNAVNPLELLKPMGTQRQDERQYDHASKDNGNATDISSAVPLSIPQTKSNETQHSQCVWQRVRAQHGI